MRISVTSVSFYLKITPVFSCQRHFHEIYDVITAPIVSINKKNIVSAESANGTDSPVFSCFVLGIGKRAEFAPCRKRTKILETRATACHFTMLFLSGDFSCRRREDDSAARLEYFQLEDGHREIGFDGYSEIVRVRRP